ncbi:MAG TPA: type IV pilus assembly protein PilM [Candidatus Sumerlaeota bacterium]|nr:type IV pilus assembly protein PilM [Candidatus Sumerlaeota bacterium]HOR26873.1 type IV pilus assembly protein PilM [Candidatus Sumerlaeota bacterium]HPK01905.1 type IV pilus assembly protein PilM [Candidatus Sumerlaeota bacterium]
MFKSKTPIGVDIGSHSVKVCQLRRTGDSYELERFGMADIYPEGEPPRDAAGQTEAKTEALKRALASAGIKSRQAISSVCGESIIVRYLQLPEMPENELKKALQWEAEEYIPFRLSEVNLDSAILGRVPDGEIPKMDVLLVSAKKDLVQRHVSVLRGAGLEPRVVDVDSFAFMNCYELNYEQGDECTALVNIGSEITSINVFSAGTSRFSRDILIGGQTITQAIRSHLGCNFADAENLKMAYGTVPATGGDEDGGEGASGLLDTIRGTIEEMTEQETSRDAQEYAVRKAVQAVVHNLLVEVRRSIEFFEGQYRGINVGRVILGGGTAGLPNLRENVEQELRLPVELMDPLRRVRVPQRSGFMSQAEQMRHQLGVAIGLGIRGLAA